MFLWREKEVSKVTFYRHLAAQYVFTYLNKSHRVHDNIKSIPSLIVAWCFKNHWKNNVSDIPLFIKCGWVFNKRRIKTARHGVSQRGKCSLI